MLLVSMLKQGLHKQDLQKQGLQYLGFDIYENSINHIGIDGTVFMARENEKTIIIATNKSFGFHGYDKKDGVIRADLNHENACILRKLFPWTAPVRGLKNKKSFGLGDRLGFATPGHIDLFKKNDVFPFFAQQSMRELNLTKRTYEDVLDAVSFAVFREGYKIGFGADGDHLKTAEDIEYVLKLGFTMITLDCSDHIKNNKKDILLSQNYKDKYINQIFKIEDYTLTFSEEEIKECISIYDDALIFINDIYKRFFINDLYNADLELSIDETVSVTTPLHHFFVAKELSDLKISFATIAPRFCGEFQKGIDYIGDIEQFKKEIKIHAAIARFFGYKLSVHSGSDKFSIFPFIGNETKGNFHIKTAGTNWLEAVKIAAEEAPSLYREIHLFALKVFDEAKKYYHVTADLSKIPNISDMNDNELPLLFNNNDVRQLIHITYGKILCNINADGSFVFKDKLFKILAKNEEKYRNALVKHIGKHLELLEVYQ